jgi:Xaa-Pro aminopeptidase
MTNLVDWSLMRKEQIVWLNEHNKSVKEALEPLLQDEEDKQARDWLTRVCKPKKIWPWT